MVGSLAKLVETASSPSTWTKPTRSAGKTGSTLPSAKAAAAMKYAAEKSVAQRGRIAGFIDLPL